MKKRNMFVCNKGAWKKNKNISKFVRLEGNMTRPIPGDASRTSMVFWYDPKEEQKIHSDKL